MLHEHPEEIREYVLTLLRKGPNDPVHPLPLVETNAKRADVAILQAMRTIPSSQQEKDEALAKVERDQRNNPNTRREHRVFPFLNATLAKEQGNALYLKAEYGRAIEKYKEAIRAYLGKDAMLPVQNGAAYYDVLSVDEPRSMVDLLACASNIAQCYLKQGKLVEVSGT